MNSSICLSISEHHQEEWDPMWNATTIITGLISLMNTETAHYHNWVNMPYQSIKKIADESAAKVRATKIYKDYFKEFQAVIGISKTKNEEEKQSELIEGSDDNVNTSASSNEQIGAVMAKEELIDEREVSCCLCYNLLTQA